MSKKLVVLIICSMLLSSCATLSTMYDNTHITYNAKKNKIESKTKVNKHLTIKY